MEKFGINASEGMEFGLYTLGDNIINPITKQRLSEQERIKQIIDICQFAEQAGIDVFGIGESHQPHYVTQAPNVILAALAQATKTIKLTSSTTVLSIHDPVRIFEDFATIDLISNGRAEIYAGRGAMIGGHQLFGIDLKDYESIFEEKLYLLKLINENERVTWEGTYRKPLHDVEILPRPLNGSLPIWRGVSGPPQSAIKAGKMGIPMVLSTLGGPVENFQASVSAYRRAARREGYDSLKLPIATASLFYVAQTTREALTEMYPHLDAGSRLSRGTGYPKHKFAQAPDYRDALMVGDPKQILEKLLYQYELFSTQRFLAQIDFGGVPYEKIMKNIDIIGNEIIPQLKKYTRKSNVTI